MALWDGEEYGLYGSTEYAEQQGARLGKTVAYLNMDIAAGKDFSAGAVPSLDNLIKQVSHTVSWPGYRNLYAAWSAQSHGKVQLDRLGSGSDYTAPLDRYGVPAADIGASTPSGDYHCSCDNLYMESHFIDPTWRYHVAVTQEIGTVMLRLADADVPTLDYANYAGAVHGYLKALRKTERTTYGRQVLNLAPALSAARAWGRAATLLNRRTEGQLARGANSGAQSATTSLLADERELVTQRGLPGRPWYRHQIYAPGQTTGYAVEYLPGITDALTSHRPALARTYLAALVKSLRHATTTLQGG